MIVPKSLKFINNLAEALVIRNFKKMGALYYLDSYRLRSLEIETSIIEAAHFCEKVLTTALEKCPFLVRFILRSET